ncbi:MAG: hypothetical protein ACJAS1_000546 [Oleiphilaceae bacterium]|jgi:hypothetical protein
MKIELKKITVNEKLSRESNYFSVNIYLEGRRFGVIYNHGKGAGNSFEGNMEIYNKVNDYLFTLEKYKLPNGTELHHDIDSFCNEKVVKQLNTKDYNRGIKKKISYKKTDSETVMEVPIPNVNQ